MDSDGACSYHPTPAALAPGRRPGRRKARRRRRTSRSRPRISRSGSSTTNCRGADRQARRSTPHRTVAVALQGPAHCALFEGATSLFLRLRTRKRLSRPANSSSMKRRPMPVRRRGRRRRLSANHRVSFAAPTLSATLAASLWHRPRGSRRSAMGGCDSRRCQGTDDLGGQGRDNQTVAALVSPGPARQRALAGRRLHPDPASASARGRRRTTGPRQLRGECRCRGSGRGRRAGQHLSRIPNRSAGANATSARSSPGWTRFWPTPPTASSPSTRPVGSSRPTAAEDMFG